MFIHYTHWPHVERFRWIHDTDDPNTNTADYGWKTISAAVRLKGNISIAGHFITAQQPNEIANLVCSVSRSTSKDTRVPGIGAVGCATSTKDGRKYYYRWTKTETRTANTVARDHSPEIDFQSVSFRSTSVRPPVALHVQSRQTRLDPGDSRR